MMIFSQIAKLRPENYISLPTLRMTAYDIEKRHFITIHLLYNICSSGAASQGRWDTCGWIQQSQRWQGRAQIWLFGSDVFTDGVVPWTYPAIANPTGDLTPFSIFGFPLDSQLQVFTEYPFTYITP